MTTEQRRALGEQIRSARRAAKMTTRDLAEHVGFDQSQLVRLEAGSVARPQAILLQRIAEAVDVPLADLYRLADIPLPPLRPYLRVAYGLSDDDTAKAERYINRLVRNLGGDEHGPRDGADEQPEQTVKRRSPRRQKGGNP